MSLPAIYTWRSPNFSDRDAGISLLVLHYTGMRTGSEALERLCMPEAKVSAHYVVEEDGTLFALVDEKQCAWHAGVSYWRGLRNVNAISIGIEIVNPGHAFGYRPFPAAQMETVRALCADIVARHAIAPWNIVGHSDIAPARKEDPGELFDWQWLHQQGIGMWPVPGVTATLTEGCETQDITTLQQNLARFGYEVVQSGGPDRQTCKVISAFQRHFRPSDCSGLWDGECEILLQSLLRQSEPQ